MSDAMSSDSDCREDPATGEGEDGVSSTQQPLTELNDRLALLTDRVTLCRGIVDDLKGLMEALKGKSLQDVSFPLQK